MSSPKKITLKSSDGDMFEVDEVVAMESLMIKYMMEDDCANSIIPVPNVTYKILSKLIESSSTVNADLKTWDADFVKVNQNTLALRPHLGGKLSKHQERSGFNVPNGGGHDQGKDSKGIEIHKFFNITNDFTPEEEEEIQKENAWAFE